MNNDVHQDASCCLLQFEGELRADHIEGLCDMILAPSETPRYILVDCQRVDRCDDAAIEALAALERCAADAGGKVMVVGLAHPKLSHVMLLEPQPHQAPTA